MENIAENIIRLREKANWSQSELARQAGITNAAISMIEKGNRNPALLTAIKIADAFKMKLDDLCTHDSPNNIYNSYAKIFYLKYSVIDTLDEKDQNFILKIANRLNNKGE